MGKHVLVVDDELKMRRLLQMAFEEEGHRVTLAEDGARALEQIRSESFDLIVTDIRMPQMDGLELLREIRKINEGIPIIIMTAYGTVPSAVEAMKAGADDYILKPFDVEQMKLSAARALRIDRLVRELEYHQEELERRYKFENIVGDSAAMRRVFEVIEQVAATRSTVLISGESGTGKELVARAIHFNGSRAKGSFVVVNCAAIAETLLESELFGHVKGAFTGAHKDRMGRFELADGGTLFLDEIGAMKQELQAKLLRVIEGSSFERLGGTRSITTDVRILAATNRDLKKAVDEGAFRNDLYYRLRVVPIEIPPLRERRGDILQLADHFLREISEEIKKPMKGFSAKAQELLVAYDWPGNVRELENVIERAVVLARDNTVMVADLPLEADAGSQLEAAGLVGLAYQEAKRRMVEKFDRAFFTRLMKDAGGRVAEAARRARMDRKNLYEKLRALEIDWKN